MYLFLYNLFAVEPTACAQKNTLFIFIHWYHYLPTSPQNDFFPDCSIQSFQILPKGNIPSDIPLVLLAVVDDLLRLAGLIAVGFVIYGAIQYVISQGEPEKTGKAKNTITDALVGLVISMLAVAVVTFLGNRLGGP
jgi:hypothetical protein